MDNSKIVSTKKTIAFFLAIVLVTGTIALSFSLSSFITAYSQVQPLYYNNGIDNNYQFQKNSVNINKIKCINDNININGENTGDVNIGNKGQGYFGANSYGGEGYGSEGYGSEGYYDNGYNNNKKDKGFDCIINNNNININTVGGGNVTDGNDNVTATCEDCLENLLGERYLQLLSARLESQTGLIVEIGGEEVTLTSLADICSILESITTYDEISQTLTTIILEVLPPGELVGLNFDLLDCLAEALDIPIPPRG